MNVLEMRPGTVLGGHKAKQIRTPSSVINHHRQTGRNQKYKWLRIEKIEQQHTRTIFEESIPQETFHIIEK